MKQIYSARDELEANFVKGLLEEQGIEASVQGEALIGGTLPINDLAPSVWVREEDVGRATPIIDELRRRDRTDGQRLQEPPELSATSWKCPRCGEAVEGQFGACWNCGSARQESALA